MRKKKQSWPGVDPRSPEHGARLSAQRLRKRIVFNSENLQSGDNHYVAWLDLMGAGSLMSISAHKVTNAVTRIHLSVHFAQLDHGISLDTLAINDGIFIISKSKQDILSVVRTAIIYLVGNFIARPNHPDRFLARGAIAYGPVYKGLELSKQLTPSQMRSGAVASLSNIVLGAPIIQAYKSESLAPAYGIAVHESARAFSPPGEKPMTTTLWRWWQTDDAGGFSKGTPQPVLPLRDTFVKELLDYFQYLDATLPFHLIEEGKVNQWRKLAERYYINYNK